MISLFRSLFKKKKSVWIGTIQGSYTISKDKNAYTLYYHLFVREDGVRYVNVSGEIAFPELPFIFNGYNEVILPWVETGDTDFISNYMTAYNKEWWNNIDKDTGSVQEQKREVKRDFKLLKFPKQEKDNDSVDAGIAREDSKGNV